MFTVKSLDELAGYFTQKAREMQEISQKRTGLVKHNYAGQAHAYNDAAIVIRNCRLETKATRKRKIQSLDEVEEQFTPTKGGAPNKGDSYA